MKNFTSYQKVSVSNNTLVRYDMQLFNVRLKPAGRGLSLSPIKNNEEIKLKPKENDENKKTNTVRNV